jgi:hypothetical protein
VGQLDRLRLGEPDPAPIPFPSVAAIKGVFFALCVVALAATLRVKQELGTLDGTGLGELP